MEKVIIIFGVLLFSIAALAADNKEIYEVKHVSIVTQASSGEVLVSGWIFKNGNDIEVRGVVSKLGFSGKLAASKTPIHCTTSTCSVEDFRFIKVAPTLPSANKWSAFLIGVLTVDQNSDGEPEIEEAQNIGFVDPIGRVVMPEVKFLLIESKLSLTSLGKNTLVGVYETK